MRGRGGGCRSGSLISGIREWWKGGEGEGVGRGGGEFLGGGWWEGNGCGLDGVWAGWVIR